MEYRSPSVERMNIPLAARRRSHIVAVAHVGMNLKTPAIRDIYEQVGCSR